MNHYDELPSFCRDLIDAKNINQSSLNGYAADLSCFLRWFSKDKPINQIKAEDMDSVTPEDIEEFLAYLSEYKDITGRTLHNSEAAKSRKLSSIRGMFKYLIDMRYVSSNPTISIKNPVVSKTGKAKIGTQEAEKIIEAISTGKGYRELDAENLRYNEFNKERNIAMFKLLYHTGLKVAELSDLNMEDVDSQKKTIYVKNRKDTRYSGIEGITLHISDDINESLTNYLDIRKRRYHVTDNEKAFFISKKRQRLSIRSIEYIINFYFDFALGKQRRSPKPD